MGLIDPEGRASSRGVRANSTRRSESSHAPGLAARITAARLLAAVVDARTPLDGMTDGEHGHPAFRALEPRDRALVRAILLTALRFRGTIGALLARRLEKPLPGNAHTLSHILHVAAAQILFLGIPDSAAVDLAVRHAKSDPRTVRFAPLVNGVLRSLARGKDEELSLALEMTSDAPAWFRGRLLAAYGAEKTAAILAVHRIEPATDFTVKSDPEGWAERLGGIVLPTGSVRVAKPEGAVADLPGYAQGAWWVQDVAAALPIRLLGPVAGLRVADLCATPGGKTAQLALAGARVTAVDASKSRLVRLQANLDRLGLPAACLEADILTFEPPETFDAVLLDAPCSSTGTVRRHPDVPWTKSQADVDKLAELQRRLLVRALGWVRPGGRIVFSNCSLDPAEGETLVSEVCLSTGAEREPLVAGEDLILDPFRSTAGELRTTPADLDMGSPVLSGMDGFFAARLRRPSGRD